MVARGTEMVTYRNVHRSDTKLTYSTSLSQKIIMIGSLSKKFHHRKKYFQNKDSYHGREWKLGHIVPIFKKGDKHEVSNYRPISLTCLITKVLERIIRDELLALTNGMINDKQHGFRAERSCATNLVGLCDSLALSLNENIRTGVISFDFAKAFGSVNHDLILLKLKNKFLLTFNKFF